MKKELAQIIPVAMCHFL